MDIEKLEVEFSDCFGTKKRGFVILLATNL